MTTPQTTEASAPESRVILVVDDEPAILLLITKFIAKLGFRVITVDTPQKALELAAANTPFDMVITDVILPKINGPELVARLKQVRPTLRHLYISGHDAAFFNSRGITVNQAQLLQKPFVHAEFDKKLHQIMDELVNPSV